MVGYESLRYQLRLCKIIKISNKQTRPQYVLWLAFVIFMSYLSCFPRGRMFLYRSVRVVDNNDTRKTTNGT